MRSGGIVVVFVRGVIPGGGVVAVVVRGEIVGLNRVRTSLNHKILYPSGVKTTVDMSPALFHRAKKYCLDHGNVTIRQLFLDLITEFLAEEGY